MSAKHHDDRGTSFIAELCPAISTRQKWYRTRLRPGKRWDDDINCLLTTNRNTRRKRPHRRPDMVQYSTRQLEVGLQGKRLREQQTLTTSRAHDNEQHADANRTNKNRTNRTHTLLSQKNKVTQRTLLTTTTTHYFTSFF